MINYIPEEVKQLKKAATYISPILDNYFPSADACMLLGKPYIVSPILDTKELATRYSTSPDVIETAIQFLEENGHIQCDYDNEDIRAYMRGYNYDKQN